MVDKESTGTLGSLPWAASLVLLRALPMFYFGSYLLLMNHRAISVEGIDSAGISVFVQFRDPEYRYGGEWAETIFWPAEWLDRCIRPAFWE